ncbi:MAG: hypothetical protein JJU29_18715 [Verrucomicrobia bacterium]|nr:hypothetical protein [Verrucomicrobiota bacterium]MCH8511370.1 OprO/OprP family phosphate-selective porin [Kiritimatiellia bacterium]
MKRKPTHFQPAALFRVSLLGVALFLNPVTRGVLLSEEDGVAFHMEVHTVGRLQALDHRANDKEAAGFSNEQLSDGGFQFAIGNLGWRLVHREDYEVFFDVTVASRVHNDKMWGHQGYIVLKQMPDDSLVPWANGLFQFVDIKAGHFIIDFGNEVHRRSLNADTQRNPLVGNPVVSPHATEAGIEIIHQNERDFGVMLGFGSGVATENFTEDSHLSYRGKIWGEVPGVPLAASASYYRADHGESVSRGSNLFRTERLGGQYAGIWDDSASVGQVLIGNGTQLEAWQVDADWQPGTRIGLSGFVGQAKDQNTDGDESWMYYGVTGKLNLIGDDLYLAARYSSADASRLGGDSNNDGRVDRWQVGAGARLFDGLLLKLEYVHQRSSGFQSGTFGDVELNEDPGFQGLIMEFSFSF